VSADLLRRAARELRESALAAAEVMSGFVSANTESPRRDYPAGSLGAECNAIGRFSDLWGPPVALALAGWLELEASMVGKRTTGAAGNSPEGHTFHALAVARAVLREPDPTPDTLVFPYDRPDICTPCFEDRHDACLGCSCESPYHRTGPAGEPDPPRDETPTVLRIPAGMSGCEARGNGTTCGLPPGHAGPHHFDITPFGREPDPSGGA
jgi:hypothetical protein